MAPAIIIPQDVNIIFLAVVIASNTHITTNRIFFDKVLSFKTTQKECLSAPFSDTQNNTTVLLLYYGIDDTKSRHPMAEWNLKLSAPPFGMSVQIRLSSIPIYRFRACVCVCFMFNEFVILGLLWSAFNIKR